MVNTESANLKALAIHRIVECEFDCGFFTDPNSKSGDSIILVGPRLGYGHRHIAKDLAKGVNGAFKTWVQQWRVHRELDVQEARALELDVTDVQMLLPVSYYRVPDNLIEGYVAVFDIITKFKPDVRGDFFGYLDERNISGDGDNIVERALSFRGKVDDDTDHRRKRLMKRLGISP